MLQSLNKVGWLWVVALSISQVSVQAHHAFSSEFDKDLPFLHRGTIVRMEWVNPHTWLHVDVEKEDGTTESWMMEGGTPNTLLRAGMTNVMLQPGTQVIVRGYQSKDADCEPRSGAAVATLRLPMAVEYLWDLRARVRLVMAPIHVNEQKRMRSIYQTKMKVQRNYPGRVKRLLGERIV